MVLKWVLCSIISMEPHDIIIQCPKDKYGTMAYTFAQSPSQFMILRAAWNISPSAVRVTYQGQLKKMIRQIQQRQNKQFHWVRTSTLAA